MAANRDCWRRSWRSYSGLVIPLIRAGVGFVLGVVLAFGGLWFGGADEPVAVDNATTSTSSTLAIVEPEWVPGGVRYESTVLVPLMFDVADGVAVLDYELVGLGATGQGFFGPSLTAALPETWEVEFADGSVHATTVGPPHIPDTGPDEASALEASARFTGLPETATVDDVADIRVVGWRVAAPFRQDHVVAAEVGTSFQTYDGVTVTLDTIIEQTTGSILDFDVDAQGDPWRTGERSPFGASNTFEGAGPGWISASSTIGGTGRGGSTGFQLRWSELEVPASITVRYSAVAWTPVGAEVSVFAEVRGG